jgi:hypothetical protein
MVALRRWLWNYHKGTVSATGTYLTKPGEAGPQPKEIEVPRRYACEVTWLKGDLDYLIKILEAKCPDWPVTKDLRQNFPKWKNGKLVAYQKEARTVVMDLYYENLMEIYRLLEAMQSGKTVQEKPDLGKVDLSTFTKS